MKRTWKALLGATVVAAGISPVMAQQSGLVNVDISDVKADIAKNINVDVSQIPITIQAPVGVAANVCNVAANVLAPANQGQAANCKATSTNTALNQIVQRDLGSNAAGKGPTPK